jgi:predicted nucleic acid-binding protein
MTIVDTSVAVAAFAVWHAQHDPADEAIGAGARLPAHCALETFSVLTRMPPPRRAPAHLVRDFLADRFPAAYVALDAEQYRALIPHLVELGIDGGAVYDALVAATATATGATLVSCDRRAAQTYQRLGVDFRLLTF